MRFRSMSFRIQKKELLRGLRAMRAGRLRMRSDGDEKIVLTAIDLETTAAIELYAMVKSPGEVIVDAEALSNSASAFVEGELTFWSDIEVIYDDYLRVVLTQGQRSAHLSGLPVKMRGF